MDEKVYDPKKIEEAIRAAKWTLFMRISVTFSVWTSAVALFGSLLVLLTTP